MFWIMCFSFREYALRRVRDGFKAGKNITNEAEKQREVQAARESLDMIRRQVSRYVLGILTNLCILLKRFFCVPLNTVVLLEPR